jgi:hypothetical protein
LTKSEAHSPVREPVRPFAKSSFCRRFGTAMQRCIPMELVMSLRLAIVALFLTLAVPALGVQSRQAGFERQNTADGIEVGIWYPASGTPAHQRIGLYAQDVIAGSSAPTGPHPLVVMSHGTGGDFAGHVDTAVALARAGFIVAALTHPGDNWRDNSCATQIDARPPALSALISYMLRTMPPRPALRHHLRLRDRAPESERKDGDHPGELRMVFGQMAHWHSH